MVDVICVGNFSIDSIVLPARKKPFMVLGGSTAYASLVCRHLDARVSVISKVGGDFPRAYSWWLEQENVDLTGLITVDDAKTTRFELRYSEDLSDRLLRLTSKAPSINPEDVPAFSKVKAIHIAPIAGEVNYGVMEKLRQCTDVLSLDPQGLVRDFDENGNVAFKSLVDERVLGLADIYKSSLKEIQAATGVFEIETAIKAVHEGGPKIVIVTLGGDGAVISVENTIHKVPIYTPQKLVDPTGAGDAYMGAFLAEYVRGEDCGWCSFVGSAAASLVVEGVGPTFFGDKHEIYRRARVLHEKEIK